MNAISSNPRLSKPRIAELDLFLIAEGSEAETDYGCVDWYAYHKPMADVHTPQPPARAAGTRPAGAPRDAAGPPQRSRPAI